MFHYSRYTVSMSSVSISSPSGEGGEKLDNGNFSGNFKDLFPLVLLQAKAVSGQKIFEAITYRSCFH